MPGRATWRNTRSFGMQRVRGKCGQEPLMWLLWEAAGEAQQKGLRLAGLSNFSRLWGIGTVSSCLVPGPGCESSTEEVVGCRLWTG